MKKILLVLTGGTIGSTITKNIIDIQGASPYKILSIYKEKYDDDTHFDVVNPMSILSENINSTFWETLYNELMTMSLDNYDGIIITHGSDTLAHTCAMMGFLLSHLPIPVVLVASNYSIDDERSNALDNFRSAVDLIFSSVKKGVYTVFRNNKKENIVYLSTRLLEADCYMDEFSSFGSKPFAKIEDGRFIRLKDKNNPTLTAIQSNPSFKICDQLSLKNKVRLIHPYPGMNYSELKLKNDTKVVLHYLYHSATASTENNEYSLLKFIETCQKNGVGFYVASLKKGTDYIYSTTDEILKSSASALYNISLHAAYAKLLIAYNQNLLTPKDFMKKDIFFESLI